MSLDDTLSAIERGRITPAKAESSSLDFKTEKPGLRETCQDLAEAAVCFANAVGGTIVVGVADRVAGPQAFVGCALDASLVRVKIHDLTEPNLLVEVSEYERVGKRLVAITVPEGVDVYSTRKGVFLRRWNDTCQPMRPTDVARLSEERRGVDWSAQSSGRPVEDADDHAIRLIRSYLKATGSETKGRIADLPVVRMLSELKLLCEDGALSRAAAYLLCIDGGAWEHEVLVYQHRMTRSGEADHVRRWHVPVLVAFNEAMEVIAARIGSKPILTRHGQQVSIEDYPVAAVREALVNGLVHGDLRDRRPVQIEHSPEQLVVRSAGPLVAGVTPDNILTHGSAARFPLLATAMRDLGLAEELGQGVDRMFREMIKSGRGTPRVRVASGEIAETVVEFDGGPPNLRLAKLIAELPEEERADTDALLITLVLCEKRVVTAEGIAPIIQRDAQSAEAVLRRLAHGDAELIEPTKGTSNRVHPSYRLRGSTLQALGPAVGYNRRPVSERDRKIVDHVREYETISNKTVQRLFDLDVYQARDVLRDLVGREILVRVSLQSRGTAVKYGPGPRFPSGSARRRSPTGD